VSHFAEYYAERLGAETIENAFGFIVYQVAGAECVVREIYVAKEHRHTKMGTDLVQEVITRVRPLGCTMLTATIYPAAKGSSGALAAALKVGFQLHSSQNGCIIIVKEI
jgi:GNAT superfamily N-acetyltransferase